MWYVKGALEVVLKQCVSLPDGSPLTSIDRDHFEECGRELGQRGLRGQGVKCVCIHSQDVVSLIVRHSDLNMSH